MLSFPQLVELGGWSPQAGGRRAGKLWVDTCEWAWREGVCGPSAVGALDTSKPLCWCFPHLPDGVLITQLHEACLHGFTL